MKNLLSWLCLWALWMCAACTSKPSGGAFIDKLQPAPLNGGFAMTDHWIWGSSVIKGEDGKYHIFSDMWEKSLGFGAWVTNTEIVMGHMRESLQEMEQVEPVDVATQLGTMLNTLDNEEEQ